MSTSLTELEVKYNDLLRRFEDVKKMNDFLSQQAKESILLFESVQQIMTFENNKEYFTNLDNVLTRNLSINEYALFYKSANSDFLTVIHSFGLPKQELRETFYRVGEGLVGKVFDRKQTIYIPDARVLKNFLYYNEVMNISGSLYYLPLDINDEPIGVLKMRKYSLDGFTDTDRSLLPSLKNPISESLKKIYSENRQKSYVDPVTDLFNHHYFRKQYDVEFKRAQRYGHELSLVSLFLDGIRKSDSKLQDMFLKKFTEKLQRTLRTSDLAIRFKRNQFVVLLPETNTINARGVLEKVNKVFGDLQDEVSMQTSEQRFQLQGKVVNYPNDSIEPLHILNLIEF